MREALSDTAEMVEGEDASLTKMIETLLEGQPVTLTLTLTPMPRTPSRKPNPNPNPNPKQVRGRALARGTAAVPRHRRRTLRRR